MYKKHFLHLFSHFIWLTMHPIAHLICTIYTVSQCVAFHTLNDSTDAEQHFSITIFHSFTLSILKSDVILKKIKNKKKKEFEEEKKQLNELTAQ